MGNPRRQHKYTANQAKRSMRRNKRQEAELPSEDFTAKDFARMEAQARRAMQKNRKRFNG